MSQFEPFDFYLLRMPVFPYSNIMKGLGDKNDIANLVTNDTDQSIFQEAIFLASSELYMEMQKWLSQASVEKKNKVSIALYKYLLRMATRSTPFGLFAGCSLGSLSSSPTNIRLAEMTTEKIYRLDTECYSKLVDGISFLDESLLRETVFYPNTSIYNIGQTYRYYEYKIIDDKRSYYLSSFSKNKYINTILSISRNGASFNKLAKGLSKKNVQNEEAIAFLKTLIENQILISEYAPRLTGGNQLNGLISLLLRKKSPLAASILKEMLSLQSLLLNPYNSIIKYPSVIQILKNFIPDLKQKNCIQADTIFNLDNNTINYGPINEIALQVEQLLPLNTTSVNNDLEKFRNSFYQKFEDREIPLFEALDSDLGVGYGTVMGEETFYTPLIDDLDMGGNAASDSVKWTSYEDFVMNKFLRNKTNDGRQITITDDDLKELSKNTHQEKSQRLPATFSILGTIISRSQDDLDRLNFSFLLKNCGGNSAISMMSRFGSERKDIADALENVIAYEKEMVPDKVLAEVIHLPDGRVGNVLARPPIFDYEIPFLASSSKNEQYKIPVNDLYVSVKNNRIVLWSAKLCKEVLPRLTSAHNFSTGLPVYKFLCDLQYQSEGLSIGWNWGVLDKLEFLPRVVYKNIILKRCRWFMAIKKNMDQNINGEGVIEFFQKKHQMPDLVLLAEGDNELLLDLKNNVSKAILLSKISKGDVILYEFLHEAEKGLLENKDGMFDNEIIIPVKNKKFVPAPATLHSMTSYLYANRSFAPGSEWLYVKIYSGYKSMDTILSEIVIPLVSGFEGKGEINKWFFVRYQDPESHLRIRFNAKHPSAFYKLIKAINKAVSYYIENRIIKKLEYGTYFQETEKYTPWAIDLCEDIFYIDSRTVLNIIDFIQNNKDEESRWLIAIKGVDSLLTDFNYTLSEKRNFMEACFLSFFKEFSGDKGLMMQLNNKYRDRKYRINDLMNEHQSIIHEQVAFFIRQRSAGIKEVHAQLIKRSESVGEDKIIIGRLIDNFVHLFLNRLFVASHRLHELVVYHHLLRYYDSAIARLSVGQRN